LVVAVLEKQAPWPNLRLKRECGARKLETQEERHIQRFMQKLEPGDHYKPFSFTVGAGPEKVK
jgi:hypothetical protein